VLQKLNSLNLSLRKIWFMECMVGIGNNYNYGYNVGGATNNQLDKTSFNGPTDISVETSKDRAKNLADSFGVADSNKVIIAGLNPSIKLNETPAIKNIDASTKLDGTQALFTNLTVTNATTIDSASTQFDNTVVCIHGTASGQEPLGEFNTGVENVDLLDNNNKLIGHRK
jgi:hypothetical protein